MKPIKNRALVIPLKAALQALMVGTAALLKRQPKLKKVGLAILHKAPRVKSLVFTALTSRPVKKPDLKDTDGLDRWGQSIYKTMAFQAKRRLPRNPDSSCE